MPQFYRHIMEGLFNHFFPDTDDHMSVYSKEDADFFLTFVNEQSIFPTAIHSDDQPRSIVFSKLKIYLDRILCRGWKENGIDAKPLNFYKSDVSTYNNNHCMYFMFYTCRFALMLGKSY